MNIFIVDSDPVVSAQSLCNSHVVKMVLESAQMLSTAHRVLDGKEAIEIRNGRRVKVYKHPLDGVLYKATHINHPSSVWTRASSANYMWHYEHFCALCREYTHRYSKTHKTDSLLSSILSNVPQNIPHGPMTEFPLAIDESCLIHNNPIESYRKYYVSKQRYMDMVWFNRASPEWFTHAHV